MAAATATLDCASILLNEVVLSNFSVDDFRVDTCVGGGQDDGPSLLLSDCDTGKLDAGATIADVESVSMIASSSSLVSALSTVAVVSTCMLCPRIEVVVSRCSSTRACAVRLVSGIANAEPLVARCETGKPLVEDRIEDAPSDNALGVPVGAGYRDAEPVPKSPGR